jgi:hypothetical protein
MPTSVLLLLAPVPVLGPLLPFQVQPAVSVVLSKVGSPGEYCCNVRNSATRRSLAFVVVTLPVEAVEPAPPLLLPCTSSAVTPLISATISVQLPVLTRSNE